MFRCYIQAYITILSLLCGTEQEACTHTKNTFTQPPALIKPRPQKRKRYKPSICLNTITQKTMRDPDILNGWAEVAYLYNIKGTNLDNFICHIQLSPAEEPAFLHYLETHRENGFLEKHSRTSH